MSKGCLLAPSLNTNQVASSRAECLQLLPVSGLGWAAYVWSGRPQLVAVTFVVQADEIVFPTGYADRLAAAVQEPVMTFGVESIDTTTRTGW